MDTLTRFSTAPWADSMKNRNVTVVGAGSIGSWLCIFLTRAGVNVHLYDDDTVEIHNLGGQLMLQETLDMPKVEAVKLTCERLGATGTVDTYKVKMKEGMCTTGEVFSCVDSMKSRRIIFNQFMKSESELLIDGGILIEDWDVKTVIKPNVDNYEESIQGKDSQTINPLCTYQNTTAVGAQCASFMFNVFCNYLCNKIEEDDREQFSKLSYTPISQRFTGK